MAKYTIVLDKNDFPKAGDPSEFALIDKLTYPSGTSSEEKSNFNWRQQTLEMDSYNITSFFSSNKVKSMLSDMVQSGGGKTTLTFEVEQSVGQTYHFMGMLVSEDFKAYTRLPNGYLYIGDMFPKNVPAWGDSFSTELFRTTLVSSTQDASSVISVLNSLCGEPSARKLATSLKMGLLHSIISRDTKDENGNPVMFGEMFKDIHLTPVDSGIESTPKYKSVIFDIIKGQEAKDIAKEIASGSNSTFRNKVICILVDYWCNLATRCVEARKLLAILDQWQSYSSLIMSQKTYCETMRGCTTISGGEEDTPLMLDFGGLLQTTPYYPNYLDGLKQLSKVVINGLSENDFAGTPATSEDVLRRNDSSHLTNVLYGMSTQKFGLHSNSSLAGAQASSILDGVAYVDDEATLDISLYNLQDPEESSLLIKGVLNSYRRNFGEYSSKVRDTVSVVYNAMDSAVSKVAYMGDRLDGDAELELLADEIIDQSDDDYDSSPLIDDSTGSKEMSTLSRENSNINRVAKLIEKAILRVLKGF